MFGATDAYLDYGESALTPLNHFSRRESCATGADEPFEASAARTARLVGRR